MKEKNIRSSVIALILVLLIGILSILAGDLRTAGMIDKYTVVYGNAEYLLPVTAIDSPGNYAAEESEAYAMMARVSAWGGTNLTESALREKCGADFRLNAGPKETERLRADLEAETPGYVVRKYADGSCTEMIESIHHTLGGGAPVLIRWAVPDGNGWKLEYACVTAMALDKDSVVVLRPNGGTELLKMGDFVNRMTLNAYNGMPLHLRLQYAFGGLEKNLYFLPGMPDQ